MRFSLLLLAMIGGVMPVSMHAAPSHPPLSRSPEAMPPHLSEDASFSPAQTPYPDASLAPVQVREAFITAAKTHRRVLLDFGGNWCPDCRMLAGVFAIPEVTAWLEKTFVIVPVNVERFKKNMDIAQHYGATIKAVPTVLMLTPQGQLLNGDATLALGNARRMSPQAVVDLLTAWDHRPSPSLPKGP